VLRAHSLFVLQKGCAGGLSFLEVEVDAEDARLLASSLDGPRRKRSAHVRGRSVLVRLRGG